MTPKKEKTAMQLLIDNLNKIILDLQIPSPIKEAIIYDLRLAIKEAKNLLPKERQQIEEAYKNGDRLFHKFDSSEYFTTTYGE